MESSNSKDVEMKHTKQLPSSFSYTFMPEEIVCLILTYTDPDTLGKAVSEINTRLRELCALEFFERGAKNAVRFKFVEACSNFTWCITLDPRSGQAYNKRGNARWNLDDREGALNDWNNAIALFKDGDPYQCHLMKSKIFFEHNKIEEALQEANAAILLRPNSAEAYFERAFCNTDPDSIIADYTKIIELNYENPSLAYNNRGLAYANRGDIELAIADYSTSLRLNPFHVRALRNRATAYENIGNLKAALEDHSRVTKLDPSAASFFDRALTYRVAEEQELAEQDFDTALQKINEAIAEQPRKAEHYILRGEIYMERKKYDDAIKEFNEALKYNPKCVAAFKNLAEAHAYKGDIELALLTIGRAIKLQPREPTSHGFRAYYLAQIGDLAAAEASCKRAIDINNKYEWAYRYLAAIYAEQDKFRDAVAVLSKAISVIARGPHMFELYRARAELQLVVGNIREAVEDLKHALTLKPNDEDSKQLLQRAQGSYRTNSSAYVEAIN